MITNDEILAIAVQCGAKVFDGRIVVADGNVSGRGTDFCIAFATAIHNKALDDAAKACHNIAFDNRRHMLTTQGAFMCKESVLALKTKE